MSESLDRIPHDRAMAAVALLVEALDIREAQIVGSLRRLVPTVGDIELVVPMAAADAPDPLLVAILDRFEPAGVRDGPKFRGVPVAYQESIFGSPAPAVKVITRESQAVLGKVIKGAKPGFRYCQLCLQLSGEPKAVVNVDIFRYDAGDQGNRGWIELIRTGPADFGKQACIRWKQISGGHSEGGYPRKRNGEIIPVPTEHVAFDLLGWDWVPPERRR